MKDEKYCRNFKCLDEIRIITKTRTIDTTKTPSGVQPFKDGFMGGTFKKRIRKFIVKVGRKK